MNLVRSAWGILTIGATLLAAAAAAAHGLHHHAGRHHGIGWSDGYHSRTACPRKPAYVPPCATCAPLSVYNQPTPVGSAALFPHWDKMPQHWRQADARN